MPQKINKTRSAKLKQSNDVKEKKIFKLLKSKRAKKNTPKRKKVCIEISV